MRHYKHLSDNERIVIQKMKWSHKSISEIARELKRNRSTIFRECKRNKSKDGLYRACEAHLSYTKRIKNKKFHIQHPIDANYDLLLYILEMLLKGWTPDIIAGKLKIDFPHDNSYHISHETIYKWIYAKSKGKVKLYRLLPQSKKKRYRRRFKRQRRINIVDRKSINIRPEEVDKREEEGHWEGDLIVGYKSRSYILNLIERKNRFIVSAKMSDKSHQSCNRAILEALADIPNHLIKTITVDNGTEFAGFKDIEEALECEVYFADPYASYQKGSIEHANMLIRRTFPKRTDFRKVSEKELQRAINKLNNRPRKVLNYLTSYEASQKPSVALET